MSNEATLRDHPKNRDFNFLYLKEVPVVYASVQATKKKYKSDEMEYCLTSFVNDDTREYLESVVKINKDLSKVGVDKNKMKNVKYPTSSQREDGKDVYDPYKGLNGISLTLNAKKKSGEEHTLPVVDKDGNPLTDLVGNGSVCNIKLFGYRNDEGLLVVSLNLVQVLNLVHYEGGDGSFQEPELGITVRKGKPEGSSAPAGSIVPDDEIPF